MSSFNSHMRQNAFFRNLSDHLKIRCHAIVTQ